MTFFGAKKTPKQRHYQKYVKCHVQVTSLPDKIPEVGCCCKSPTLAVRQFLDDLSSNKVSSASEPEVRIVNKTDKLLAVIKLVIKLHVHVLCVEVQWRYFCGEAAPIRGCDV